MRIALCLSGYIGFDDKIVGLDVSSFDKGNMIDIIEGYETLKVNVVDGYDYDIFVHSWDVEQKHRILDLYKPTDYIIEPQKGPEDGIHDGSGYSQWYSRKKVIELALNAEKKYDWIFVTRFDLIFEMKFLYEQYDNNVVYVPGEPRPVSINDLYIMGNEDNMEHIKDLFDNLESEGYNINNRNGGEYGGIHYTAGQYIRKKAEIRCLGTDAGPNKNVYNIRKWAEGR